MVEAVLGASGRIKEVVNIIGHPLLRESSRLAAEKWRFLPGFAGVSVRIRFVYRIMPLGTPPEELTTIFRSPCEVEIRCNPFQPTTLPPTPKPDRFR